MQRWHAMLYTYFYRAHIPRRKLRRITYIIISILVTRFYDVFRIKCFHLSLFDLQASKMGLAGTHPSGLPFFCPNGDHLTQPPPAHMGIPPYGTLDAGKAAAAAGEYQKYRYLNEGFGFEEEYFGNFIKDWKKINTKVIQCQWKYTILAFYWEA